MINDQPKLNFNDELLFFLKNALNSLVAFKTFSLMLSLFGILNENTGSINSSF